MAALTAALLVSACAVATDPIGSDEIRARSAEDLKGLFAAQEPLTGSLTIHEAMARVLKYNLDNRLKIMEEALSLRQTEVASVSMLPRIAASAGYVGRSNASASSSQSITTGTQSLETSTSQERHRQTSDLTIAWNVLDFGVSYVAARQQSDRALIVKERRRKVIHNILQDTRLVYWRAVAAQRLEGEIGPLLRRIDRALRDSRSIEESRLGAPLDALTYQRQLLRTRQQLLELQRDLQVAKTQLATLMDLPPATDLKLSVPRRGRRDLPSVKLTPERIEEEALTRRPELVEEAYQARIGSLETRKAMLRMLPGIELNAGVNFDSNRFLLYNRWADYGAKVVWNLFNVLTGPANIALAETQEEFIKARRIALSMAVLTQSRVAWLRYQQAKDAWTVAQRLESVEGQIRNQVINAVQSESRGQLDAIQADFDHLIANLSADLAFAEAQNAAGNILVTMGFDPLPDSLPSDDIHMVAQTLAERESRWFAGDWPSPPPPATPVAAAPVDAKPVDAKPVTVGATEAKPVTVGATETKPVTVGATETKPVETKSAKTKPVEPVVVTEAPAPSAEPATPTEPTTTEPTTTEVMTTEVTTTPPTERRYRATLGTYATAGLARRSWTDLVKRHRDLLPSTDPILVDDKRMSDGKRFVILRTRYFDDKAAAKAFCDAAKRTDQECSVSSVRFPIEG